METIIADNLQPALVKLHGDYKYDLLQNTSEELRKLDDVLHRSLIRLTDDRGILVVGYSGRDHAIMETFEQAAGPGPDRHAALFSTVELFVMRVWLLPSESIT